MAEAEGQSAGRSAIHRVERLLVGLGRARRQPNRREAYYICEALDHVRAGRYPEADEAISRAERVTPVPPAVASQLVTNHLPTLEELRADVDALIKTFDDRA
jgi:hypothetical protein